MDIRQHLPEEQPTTISPVQLSEILATSQGQFGIAMLILGAYYTEAPTGEFSLWLDGFHKDLIFASYEVGKDQTKTLDSCLAFRRASGGGNAPTYVRNLEFQVKRLLRKICTKDA